ncbi:hypothetical protein Tco_0654751 [Tanacetum coccineum]|uniref:Uncharacterized protein n=1 Tax=Tanacetum coccineum TaxID=301880 RepID=A0ABQ4X4C8_9ASTR
MSKRVLKKSLDTHVVWFATTDKKKSTAGMENKETVVCGFPLFADRTMNKNEEKAHKSVRTAKPDTNRSKVWICPRVDGDEEEDGYDDLDNEFDLGNHGNGGLDGISKGVIGDNERVISNGEMVWPLDVVFDGVLGALGEEEVVMGEGVVVTSSSLEILINNCLEGIMVSWIFLEGLDEEALVEVMVE